MKTRGLCIKDNVGHGEMIHPNREGGPRFSACKKFAQHILGKCFVIERDHKPLVPLLGTKNLDSMPPRFRLQLDRFQFSIGHVPGKELYTADALSRAPTGKMRSCSRRRQSFSWNHLLSSKDRLEEYKTAQLADRISSKVGNSCQNGWPDKHSIGPDHRLYWQEHGKFTIHNNLTTNVLSSNTPFKKKHSTRSMKVTRHESTSLSVVAGGEM